ncbi:hypothetical protein EW026_g1985 [Hermanssonia centrifuga]|uniref:UBC core domain-containing protein n=1 Tax=Hermanssonia centrifuga TaxID=98765 RepID=A0A4S4KU75_9APHY|nr:hypothetical protein EW026_g1985 [Hermanssonia centrifuga]
MSSAKTPLKGRKRFIADFKEATSAYGAGLEVGGLKVKDLRTGDDEGSILCDVTHADKHIVSLNLIVSDTSEYPGSHNYFCFAQDEDVSPRILDVIETIPDEGPRSIEDILKKLLTLFAKKLATNGRQPESDDEDSYGEDDEDMDGYDAHYDDDDFGMIPSDQNSDIKMSFLHRDFNEIVACGYRPGLTRLGIGEIVLTVSLPSFQLAQCVAPRALMAWDPRLLTTSRHFTLIISGIRGIYPVLQDDGKLLPNFIARGLSTVQFRVGLSSKYKPHQEDVRELVRTFGLKVKEEVVMETDSSPFDSEYDENYADEFLSPPAPEAAPEEVPEEEDFISFSLSDSMQSLMNDRFMDLLHLRLKYGMGWAAAETLLSELKTDFQPLKPYVCDNKLCTYQYYNLNRGPSLEYEICSRPQTIDLLVSLTYVAAAEETLEDFPIGMNLMVSMDGQQSPLVDFDPLSHQDKRRAITTLIASLPPILDMKRHLQKRSKMGASKPRLQEIDRTILPAAWSVLRWCVASCTAHLEELTSGEDLLKGIGNRWRQFRFTVGAPDAEAKFHEEQSRACATDPNANRYPSLYAFHGSAAKNWHSIIRHGLWYKTVAHGRAYGHGVYFAKEGNVSMGSYAGSATTSWRNSTIHVYNCVTVAEIVNLPNQFVSTTPYFVVPQTHWIVCRYLLVKSAIDDPDIVSDNVEVPVVTLDPRHPLTVDSKQVSIPAPAYKLEKLLANRQAEYLEEDYDQDDLEIFLSEDITTEYLPSSVPQPITDDWVHDSDWVQACIEHMMPAPVDATPMATSSLQKELKAMLREQEVANSLKELGWYMPPDLIGDNLFQWVVELHSFEKELPVAQDMAQQNVNSLVFEIRFPPDYPHSPPFFRILKPRFLPFIHGGGGHITGALTLWVKLWRATKGRRLRMVGRYRRVSTD